MFLFYLRRGDESFAVDDEPEEFADLQAARSEAIASLRELASDAALDGQPLKYDAIDIAGHDGKHLATVRASEAVPSHARAG